MRAPLAPSLLLSLQGRLIATSQTHRLEAAPVKLWAVTLSLSGVRGGEVEVRIGLGAKRPTRELDTTYICCNVLMHAQLLLVFFLDTGNKARPANLD